MVMLIVRIKTYNQSIVKSHSVSTPDPDQIKGRHIEATL
jgi:hypothetical protein